jgi:hypothetical protein
MARRERPGDPARLNHKSGLPSLPAAYGSKKRLSIYQYSDHEGLLPSKDQTTKGHRSIYEHGLVPKKRNDKEHLAKIHDQVEYDKKHHRKSSLCRLHMRADWNREEGKARPLAVQAQTTSLYHAPDNFFDKCVDSAPLAPIVKAAKPRNQKCRRGSISREFYSTDQNSSAHKQRFLDNALYEALAGKKKKKKDPRSLLPLQPEPEKTAAKRMTFEEAEVSTLGTRVGELFPSFVVSLKNHFHLKITSKTNTTAFEVWGCLAPAREWRLCVLSCLSFCHYFEHSAIRHCY